MIHPGHLGHIPDTSSSPWFLYPARHQALSPLSPEPLLYGPLFHPHYHHLQGYAERHHYPLLFPIRGLNCDLPFLQQEVYSLHPPDIRLGHVTFTDQANTLLLSRSSKSLPVGTHGPSPSAMRTTYPTQNLHHHSRSQVKEDIWKRAVATHG